MPIRSVGALLLLLVELAPASALAQNDLATARGLFEEARRLAGNKEYALACPKFEESYRLDPGVGTLLNLADCWEHIGRNASAWARFLEIAEITRRLGQTDRERLARSRAEALEPNLSRLRIEVTAQSPGLELFRDRTPFGQAQWGVDLPVDPGIHVIEARAPGRRSWSTEIDVQPDGKKAVVLIPPLTKEEPSPKASEVSPAVQPSPPADHSLPLIAQVSPRNDEQSRQRQWVSTPTLVFGGIGAAGLAIGTVFAFDFAAKRQELKSICPSSHDCSDAEIDAYQTVIEDAKTARWLSIGGFSVGGAALLSGVLYWVITDRQQSKSTAVPVVGFGTRSGALSATVTGTW